ncbi:hypothetical protein FPV67DRAFT_1666635 [Lyophyllum atratum]|nr:hypothetical protein FPV67DRAFT_1666635 [Lyophyllum atratum]
MGVWSHQPLPLKAHDVRTIRGGVLLATVALCPLARGLAPPVVLSLVANITKHLPHHHHRHHGALDLPQFLKYRRQNHNHNPARNHAHTHTLIQPLRQPRVVRAPSCRASPLKLPQLLPPPKRKARRPHHHRSPMFAHSAANPGLYAHPAAAAEGQDVAKGLQAVEAEAQGAEGEGEGGGEQRGYTIKSIIATFIPSKTREATRSPKFLSHVAWQKQ